MKLEGKIIITGIIECLTGLHIGGSKSALDIGGVDLNIIKTYEGKPFIPGSSLKGKLRSLLGREAASLDTGTDPDHLKEMFGHSDKDDKKSFQTRLLVRDAPLANPNAEMFARKNMEFDYSDVKWENRINRRSGTAIDPRQLERVPAGAQFEFQIVYDLYDDAAQSRKEGDTRTRLMEHLEALELAMRMLQDDYLGGQGSRGYGQIYFPKVQVKVKKIINGEYKEVAAIEEKALLDFQKNLSNLHTHASRPAQVSAQ